MFIGRLRDIEGPEYASDRDEQGILSKLFTWADAASLVARMCQLMKLRRDGEPWKVGAGKGVERRGGTCRRIGEGWWCRDGTENLPSQKRNVHHDVDMVPSRQPVPSEGTSLG